MKNVLKVFVALAAATGLMMAACATNPLAEPQIIVTMAGEVFSLDPDNPDAAQTVATIAIRHPVAIKDWVIQVQPIRAGGGDGQSGQGGQGAQAGQQRERPAGEQRERPAGQGAQAGGQAAAGQEGQPQQPRQSRGPFYEQTGKGTPPKEFKWNGKSTRPPRREGAPVEMVQSATDYQMILTVNDIFENTATYEGVISVDVLVRREGDGHYRIIVPSIIFPPNSGDFRLLGERDARANARILRLIGNALNKFSDYKVKVEGHSNPTTPPDTPARATEERTELKPLSEARAKAVVDYLVENDNIDRARLSFVGIGGERTVAAYDDPDENTRNRRVEFILEK
jgi:outer membrane protein OmpA-like peptidoglycan-associated protein